MAEIFGQKLVAGIPWRIGMSWAAWPAPGWTIHVALRGPGSLDLASAADGAAHVLDATAEQTGALPPGVYAWQAVAVSTAGGEVLIDRGRTEVVADLRILEAGHDARSHAERMVALITAVLENRATIEQRSYQINNRRLDRTSITDLRKLLSQYRAEAVAEDARRRGCMGIGRDHLVRF